MEAMKTTLKDIKALIGSIGVVDVTRYNDTDYFNLKLKEAYIEDIAYSKGKYGITGRVLKGSTTGTLYVITARSTAMWIF